MKLSSRKLSRERSLELNMTSMIDVVFLLLIFFMVTTSFVKTELELDPAIKVTKKTAQSTSDLDPAIVEIVENGGVYVFRVGSRDLNTKEELVDVLKQFPSESKLDGAFVKVSDGAKFQRAAEALWACERAGFSPRSYVPMSSTN